MITKPPKQAQSEEHYSTATSTWNNVPAAPSRSLLRDSEKVAGSDGRQPKAGARQPNPVTPKQSSENSLSKEQAFALITTARELVKNWQAPSLATMQQYKAAMERLIKRNKFPEEYAQTRRGFYYYRAAWVANALFHIQNTLVVINRLQKNGDRAWLTKTKNLVNPLKVLKRYPPDQERKHLGRDIKTRWSKDNKNPRTTAKRKGLGTLPDNWRERFWKSFPADSPHRLPLAILSVCGCRPGELAKGVQVELDENDHLLITITGIKTHDGMYGQEYRQLTIAPHNDEARFLLERVQQQPDGLTVFTKNTKALTEALRRHSKRLWPRRKYVVSPYSFRHQFSADLKKQGIPTEKIAMAMGHSVCRTQQYYGMQQQGRRGNLLLMVSAAKQPKRVDSPSPGQSPRHPKAPGQ